MKITSSRISHKLFKNLPNKKFCSNIPVTNNIFNYLFRRHYYEYDQDSQLPLKWSHSTKIYKNDLKEIQNCQREYAAKTWVSYKDADNSHLSRTFEFEKPHHCTNFINSIKEFCDEIDHHPEWQITEGRLLYVKLTSHFLNNNISPKDWELAAYMSRVFEDTSNFKYKGDMCCDRWKSYFLSIAVVVSSFSIAYFWYSLHHHKRIEAKDFIFTTDKKH